MSNLEDQLETLSRRLAEKGIFKPLINLNLGRPSGDSDPPTQAEATYKATAGYYDDDGQEVVTEELTAKPLEEEPPPPTPVVPEGGRFPSPPTQSTYQSLETAASSSSSHTGTHEDA